MALNTSELSSNATQVQQGREFYETGQFVEAVRIWQQAAKTFQAQEDTLNQASTLSFLSLAYQQLGQWTEATEAIANSLKVLYQLAKCLLQIAPQQEIATSLKK